VINSSFHEWSVAERVKRRRISHTIGRNPRSSIETSVRTYFFRFNNVYISAPKLDHHVLGEKDSYVKFVSVSTPCTHAWTPEKNRLIIIIRQCNTEHKNVFLHIPGLKITQIKIPRNVVDVFGTLTKWRHMKISSLKRKDQTSFGFVYASILIKYITKISLQGRRFNYFGVLLYIWLSIWHYRSFPMIIPGRFDWLTMPCKTKSRAAVFMSCLT
jgi:hypothetical protein